MNLFKAIFKFLLLWLLVMVVNSLIGTFVFDLEPRNWSEGARLIMVVADFVITVFIMSFYAEK